MQTTHLQLQIVSSIKAIHFYCNFIYGTVIEYEIGKQLNKMYALNQFIKLFIDLCNCVEL